MSASPCPQPTPTRKASPIRLLQVACWRQRHPFTSTEATLRGTDAALENMYYEPVKKIRIDTVRRSEPHTVESPTRDLSYTVGAATSRATNDNVSNDKHHTEVDDLFAEWDSDPLALLSLSDLGM